MLRIVLRFYAISEKDKKKHMVMTLSVAETTGSM